MSERDYLTCAETAKLVRLALRRSFPGVKFSVRSSVYSGGASIDVTWTDGPSKREVESVVGVFAGAGFDGSIDLKYYIDHVLLPDGTVYIAHSSGTQGSMGFVPEIHGLTELAEIVQGARRVHFGANFIFCERGLSESARAAVVGYIETHGQDEGDNRWGVGYAGRWMDGDLDNVVWKLGEALSDPQQQAAHMADRAQYPDGTPRAWGR
jgi:Large polyvalent protein associated domain 29